MYFIPSSIPFDVKKKKKSGKGLIIFMLLNLMNLTLNYLSGLIDFLKVYLVCELPYIETTKFKEFHIN